MFTVICSSYICLEGLKKASLAEKEEWGFDFVCPDKNKLERNTVGMAADLS